MEFLGSFQALTPVFIHLHRVVRVLARVSERTATKNENEGDTSSGNSLECYEMMFVCDIARD